MLERNVRSARLGKQKTAKEGHSQSQSQGEMKKRIIEASNRTYEQEHDEVHLQVLGRVEHVLERERELEREQQPATLIAFTIASPHAHSIRI